MLHIVKSKVAPFDIDKSGDVSILTLSTIMPMGFNRQADETWDMVSE